MGVKHMARTMAKPIPVPPLSRRVVKKLSKIRPRLLGETPSPLSATLSAANRPRAGPLYPAMNCHGVWHCRRDWKRRWRHFLPRCAWAYRVAAGANIERRDDERKAAITADSLGSADRDGIFRAGEIAQAGGDFRQPAGVGDDVVEKLAAVVVVHVRGVDIVTQ